MSVEGVSRREWQRIDRTLLSVQYLRAGAAVAVLSGHAIPAMPGQVMQTLSLSLDLFFLISGFLVVIISAEDTRPIDFFVDRLARIVPLYWILTGACFFLIYSGILAPQFNPIRLAATLSSGDWIFLANSLLFIPVQSAFEPDLNPVMPQGWTLNYEMMFYLLFALALYLPGRRIVPVLTVGFCALVLLGWLHNGGPAFRFWTSPIIFEFIFGLWVGLAWKNGWDFRLVFLGLMVAWIPIEEIATGYFLDWPFQPQRMTHLPWILALFMVVIALDRRNGGLPEWKSARMLGDASYSIYLFHFIPIILLDRIGRSMPVDPLVYFCGVGLGGLIGGFATYYLLERPIMHFVREARRARRQKRADAVAV